MNDNQAKLVEFIKQTIPITTEKAVAISKAFQYIEFKKGDYIAKQGKVSDYYLFLAKGIFRSFLYGLMRIA